jgi:hypothetical protein
MFVTSHNIDEYKTTNHHRHCHFLPALALSLMPSQEQGGGDCGTLEDCGRWLMPIPHNNTLPSNRCRSIRISSLRLRGLGRGGVGGVARPTSKQPSHQGSRWDTQKRRTTHLQVHILQKSIVFFLLTTCYLLNFKYCR